MPGYTWKEWNELILRNLRAHNVKSAIFFNCGRFGDFSLIDSWNKENHLICNHSFSHGNYNRQSLEEFQLDFLKNDSIIRRYSNYTKIFRFPFLKEGESREKIDGARKFLKEKQYKNGHVTIDASDWYINERLIKRLEQRPDADIEGYKKFYLQHLMERAQYYETLSFELNNRHIPHTILLHHNLTSALFLGDLIQMFKDKGWRVVDAKEAFSDKIFSEEATNVPAGESLIWAKAKESGKFAEKLRYPAEDGDYEKVKMDQLGL
jgi:peptidoglycan/xylan/chitin deacetylase (PgdA/CDA1 family)